jgi:hypothetical protein
MDWTRRLAILRRREKKEQYLKIQKIFGKSNADCGGIHFEHLFK